MNYVNSSMFHWFFESCFVILLGPPQTVPIAFHSVKNYVKLRFGKKKLGVLDHI